MRIIAYLCGVKALMKIVAITLALLISVSGSGAYYAHYCCHKCQEQGVLGILEDKCNELHQGDACCGALAGVPASEAEFHSPHHNGACTVEFVLFDFERLTHEQLASAAILTPVFSSVYTDSYNDCRIHHSHYPPPYSYSGRDYLSFYSTLLI